MGKFLCWMLGHKLVITQKFSVSERRCYCHRCADMFAMNDSTKSFLPWDSDFHQMYEDGGTKVKYSLIEGVEITL